MEGLECFFGLTFLFVFIFGFAFIQALLFLFVFHATQIAESRRPYTESTRSYFLRGTDRASRGCNAPWGLDTRSLEAHRTAKVRYWALAPRRATPGAGSLERGTRRACRAHRARSAHRTHAEARLRAKERTMSGAWGGGVGGVGLGGVG